MSHDLSAEIQALCDKLGLEHDTITKIVLTPDKATAEVILRNDEGRFYTEGPNETLARETRYFNLSHS